MTTLARWRLILITHCCNQDPQFTISHNYIPIGTATISPDCSDSIQQCFLVACNPQLSCVAARNFFFLWHYSPLWSLACRTMSFHFFSYLPPTLPIFSLPALEDLFQLPLSIFSWVPLPRPFQLLSGDLFAHPIHPPPFSLGDVTSLSFALLSILLYFSFAHLF